MQIYNTPQIQATKKVPRYKPKFVNSLNQDLDYFTNKLMSIIWRLSSFNSIVYRCKAL